MTIAFEKLEACLLVNRKVRAEHDALAPELDIAVEPRGGPCPGPRPDLRPGTRLRKYRGPPRDSP